MWNQLAVNGFVAACQYALVAISFWVVFRTSRFFHFTHAAVFTVGPYAAFLFYLKYGMPLWFSCLFAVAAAALLGCTLARGVYQPLRRHDASPLILLLVSLGAYTVLQNIISLAFGDGVRSLRSGVVTEGISLIGARITPVQIGTICLSVMLILVLALFLRYARLGRAMRAVASDPELANLSGITSDRVILWAFAIGSVLVGVAGILAALDVDMTPTMGMSALMMGIVAVIIGGVNSIPGIALGALLLGMAQQFGVWKISSQWQDAIAFIILLAFLFLRPQGFMGRKVKKATV